MGWPGVSASHSHSRIQADQGATLCSLVLVTEASRRKACGEISITLLRVLSPYLTSHHPKQAPRLHAIAMKLESVVSGGMDGCIISDGCHGPEIRSEFSSGKKKKKKKKRWEEGGRWNS